MGEHPSAVRVTRRRLLVEDEAVVRRALRGFEGSGADLSDHMILETARDASALPVLTFDQRFAREGDVALLSSDAPLPR